MWWWLACAVEPTSWQPAPEERPELELVSSDVSCDVDASVWRVEALATLFSGGATTVWSADGEYAETHPVPVVRSAADGTGDELEATFPVVGDWRLATHTKTAFSCADAPSVAVVLLDPERGVAGCEVHGDRQILRELAPAECHR